MVYADDFNILGGRVHAVKKNTDTSVVVCMETGLEIRAGKTKYMVMSRDHNSGRSHKIKIDNSSCERVE